MILLRRALMQAGLLMAGGAFLVLAALLLAVAAWLQLVAMVGPVGASLAMAGAFLVLGTLLLGLSGLRARRRVPREDRDDALRAFFAEAGLRVPEPGEAPPLIDAFLFGLTVALRLNRAGRR